jgi:hypothetical protein
MVEQNLVVNFDDDPVKEHQPVILDHCGSYSFQKGQSLPVVDNQGWDMLWPVLFDYVGNSDFSCQLGTVAGVPKPQGAL